MIDEKRAEKRIRDLEIDYEYHARIDVSVRLPSSPLFDCLKGKSVFHISHALDDRLLDRLRMPQRPSNGDSWALIEFDRAMSVRRDTINLLSDMIANGLSTILDKDVRTTM